MPPRVRAEPAASTANGAPDGSTGTASREAAARPVALALARVHLRLGSLALARTELEMLEQAGELDHPGRIDLAEVRWRSGDLTGAAEAASIALSAGEEDPIALAISAEAAAADGRPNEARRLATRALDRASVPVDVLFAGMPRSGVWPADAADPPPTAATLFHHEPSPVQHLRAGDTDPAVAQARAAPGDRADDAEHDAALGLWDSDGASVPQDILPDPADELEAARAALASGAIDEGVLRLGLVLRLAPALAPAVLDATQGITGAAANLVRGDAFRLVGLEVEADREFAAVAWSGKRDRRGRPSKAVDRRTSKATADATNGVTPEATDSGGAAGENPGHDPDAPTAAARPA